MNEQYAKKLILNCFTLIVRTNLLHNFVYDDETEDELQNEAENFGIDDLDKSLNHFETSAGELRSLLNDIDGVFDVELNEENYWVEGHGRCPLSRKEASINTYLGMISLIESDIRLVPELTFSDIFNDINKQVMQKLQ